MSDDRREHERGFPRRRSARLHVDGITWVVQLLDESDGGFGLYSGDELFEIAEGARGELLFEDEGAYEVLVRHVKAHARGGWMIGVECVLATSTRPLPSSGCSP